MTRSGGKTQAEQAYDAAVKRLEKAMLECRDAVAEKRLRYSELCEIKFGLKEGVLVNSKRYPNDPSRFVRVVQDVVLRCQPAIMVAYPPDATDGGRIIELRGDWELYTGPWPLPEKKRKKK